LQTFALVSGIPNSLQPFFSLRIEVVELIEQESARASSEKPFDHGSGAKDLSVWPVGKMLHAFRSGFATIRVLANQRYAWRCCKLGVNVREANPQ
jgi:hypothetical protein